MIAETPWKSGQFQSTAGPQRILFGHMYEDVAIERAAFAGRPRVFAIASAGCTALALSAHHQVVACDINPVQLAYAERRLAGGPPERGDAERAMSFARRFMPLIGWTPPKLATFLALSDPTAQLAYWRDHLDTARFRAGLDLLMSPALLRFVYSPELLSCLPPRFGQVVRARFARAFARHPNHANPYLYALFLGLAPPSPTPVPHRVELVHADAAAYLESCPPRSFDAFTISNILDGAPSAYRLRLRLALRRAAAPGAVLVRRSFSEPPPNLTNNRAADDRALLWGVVAIEDPSTLLP